MENIRYTLNGLLADLEVTVNNTEDKYLVPISNGYADIDRLVAEMKNEDSGLRREVIVHVLELERRVVERLLMGGVRVNTGLYSAAASFTGAIVGNQWDPERNSIVVKFRTGTSLREAIKETEVKIVADRGSTMYIAGVEDVATRSTNATATAGRPFTVKGNRLKVAGTDASVGITLVAEDGATTAIVDLIVNEPKTLTFLIPSTVAAGEYTLRVTTQYLGSTTRFLKTPQTVEKTIWIGTTPAASTGSGSDTNNSSGDTDGEDYDPFGH